MRVFLCSIDESVWDAVEIGWTRPKAAKSTWDKATLAVANANSKALNAIFCSVSPYEFHKISHATIANKACQIFHYSESLSLSPKPRESPPRERSSHRIRIGPRKGYLNVIICG